MTSDDLTREQVARLQAVVVRQLRYLGRLRRRMELLGLPPLAEQQEIVRRVEAMFALSDKIERRVADATARVEKLTQAILGKAFRGELVPTEAELAAAEARDYEPASILLERIHATRPENGISQPTARRRRRADGDGEASLATLFDDSPAAERANRAAPPLPIDQSDRDQVLAVIRDVLGSGPLPREQAIREIAAALGYQRLGSRIAGILEKDVRTAVRRGILENTGDGVRLLCRSITDYERDFLIEQLISDMGTSWWERDELIDGTARYLGFRRTGPMIRDTLKSAITGAIRRGLLESEGSRVRKAR